MSTIHQTMEKALRSCLLATAAHVGPGHIEAHNQVREALRLIDGDDAHRTDPPEAVEWAQLTGNAPTLAADNGRLRDTLEDAMCLMPYARFDGLTLEEHAEKHPEGFPARLLKKVRDLSPTRKEATP